MASKEAPKPAVAPVTTGAKPAAIAAPKKEGFIGKITNKMFSDLPLNASARVGGIVKSIDESEGNYGTVTKFKGDFALIKDTKEGAALIVETATSMFIPEAAKNLLKAALLSLGKWERVEFVVVITRAETGFVASWAVTPRHELPRSVALVTSAK